MKKRMVYLLGDMLKKGSVKCREEEVGIIRGMGGYEVYSAIEQKDINDKKAQTVESNNTLAERIVAKDSEAIRRSDLIIAEIDNNNVGSCVEVGQIMEFNWFRDWIVEILNNSDNKNFRKNLITFLGKYPRKECHFHSTDIRMTDLPESGYRRSFSFNQYLVGACLKLNKDGIGTFDEIVKKLKGDAK